MNRPDPQPPSDPGLSALLRAWEVPSAPPHGFTDAVWRRLDARTEARTQSMALPFWRSVALWLDLRLRQPLAAPACVTLLLLTGFAAGAVHGRASSSALTAGLQARYVQSIDPFADLTR